MKKFAIIPVAALLMLGSCSDDEPVITIPEAPVKTQPATPDNATLTVPKQTSNKFESDGSLNVYSYDNGQKIAYTMTTGADGSRIAVVKKISGTAADVTIPYVVTGMISETETAEWAVIGIDLYYNSVSENVTSLTIPRTAYRYILNSNVAMAGTEQMYKIAQFAPSVKDIELEQGFPGFCSINGAIYTDDMETIVAVPRAKAGEFAVAEGTKYIGDLAFSHCDAITAVTLPASLEAIGKEAFTFDSSLLVINITADNAPTAYTDTFGEFFAQNGELRVKKGTLDQYMVTEPTLERPIAPVEPAAPGEDATEEDYAAFETALEKYEEELAAYEDALDKYDTAWQKYNEKAGYTDITSIIELK